MPDATRPGDPGTQATGATAACVDVSFPLVGERIALDYRGTVLGAVERHLPWFSGEPACGLVGIRTAGTASGSIGPQCALLSRRSRLVLRVPASRRRDVRAICGQRIDAGAGEISVGEASERTLLAWPTLHAEMVDLGIADEEGFAGALALHLARFGTLSFVLGRERGITLPGGALRGYSVAVHGCTPAISLRLQEQGVGASRAPGCGIFLPHKSIEVAQEP